MDQLLLLEEIRQPPPQTGTPGIMTTGQGSAEAAHVW